MLELVALALKNIVKRKKRAILTILGTFIGIAAVVALVSLGQGLQQTINTQFEKVGADKIIIQPKELGGIGFGGTAAPGPLRKREIEIAAKVKGVAQTAAHLMQAGQVRYKDVQRTLYLMSIPETQKEAELLSSFGTWEAENGRLLAHKDRQKAMLGYNLANKKMFGRNIGAGSRITINNETFEVVGTLKRIGDPISDSSIVLPENDMKRITGMQEAEYSMIIAQSATGENPDVVAERIEKELRKDRHQKEGREDFIVQTSTDLIQSFNTVFNIVQAVFSGIAAISLIVGGIGIMNVMFTAVLERTREIGVMKAIGARNKDILLLFLAESGMLGLAGGGIGAVIGIGIAKTVEIAANSQFGQGTITAVMPYWLIIGAVMFSFIAGTISGALPAIKASRLKPAESLRYE